MSIEDDNSAWKNIENLILFVELLKIIILIIFIKHKKVNSFSQTILLFSNYYNQIYISFNIKKKNNL